MASQIAQHCKRKKWLTHVAGTLLVIVLSHFENILAADNVSTGVQQRNPIVSPNRLRNSPEIPTDFEDRLGQFFATNRCDKINEMAPPDMYSKLRPFVLAVLASCDPPGQDPIKIFEAAEAVDPNNELILLLFGRYLWKHNPSASQPIWEKLKFRARSKALSQLADDYLSGESEESPDRGFNTLTTFINLQIGTSYEDNPYAQGLSVPGGYGSEPSAEMNLNALLNFQKRLDWGNFGGTYNFSNNIYGATPLVNLLENDFEFPMAVIVSSKTDIGIRPFASFVSLAGSPYFSLYGLGFLHYYTREAWKQYIQFSFYEDVFGSDVNRPQGGRHYRLEYRADQFRPEYFSAGLAYVEHVEAGVDTQSANSESVPYSHDDAGLLLFFDHEIVKGFSLGLYPRAIYRHDRDPSVYINSLTGQSGLVKRREDLITGAQFNVSYDLPASFSIFAWYEYDQTFSTMGIDTYLDRNTINQITGLALRYTRATF